MGVCLSSGEYDSLVFWGTTRAKLTHYAWYHDNAKDVGERYGPCSGSEETECLGVV